VPEVGTPPTAPFPYAYAPGGSYPPPGSYPPAGQSSPPGSYPVPPAGSYPPPGSYPAPGGYPPPGSYPPPGGYPPPGKPGWHYPGMPPQKPRVSRPAVIVTVVAIVVVLAWPLLGLPGFFALRHDDSVDRAEGHPAGSPTAFPLPSDLPSDEPDSTGATHPGDIRQFILQRPGDARAWKGAPAEEALDLKGAAANFADPDEGKLILQRYSYKDGYTRRWVDKDGDYVTVRVLRFATAGDGDNFTNFYIDANQGDDWGEPKPVPGLDRAAGFVQPKKTKDGYQRSLAVGDAGDIVAIVRADQLPPARASVPDSGLTDEFGLL